MLKKTTNVETHRTEGPNVLARPFAWIARWVMVAVVGVGESPCPKWPSARSLGSCQLSALRANGVHYEMDIFIFKKECVCVIFVYKYLKRIICYRQFISTFNGFRDEKRK
jgi:hypothetical protein